MAGGELMPEATAPTGTGPRGDEPVKPGIDYRQVQQPVEMVKPWHLPNSGAASAAEELAHALKSFSNTAGGINQKLNAQAGEEAGRNDAMNGTFTPKTGLSGITAFGQNYNTSGHTTYLSQTQVSIITANDAAEQAYAHDPAGYQAQMQAIKEQTLKQTPDMYKPEVAIQFDSHIAAGSNRIQEAAIKQGQEDAAFAYSSAQPLIIKSAVRDAQSLPQNQQAARIQQTVEQENAKIDNMRANGVISQEKADAEKANVVAKFKEEMYEGHATSVANELFEDARKGDVPTSDKKLAAYTNRDDVTDEDKVRVTQKYEQIREQHVLEQSQLHAQEISQLNSFIAQEPGQKEGRGAFGPHVDQSIEDMHTKGWISDHTAETMHAEVARNAAKGKEDDTGVARFDAALHGEGPPLDPQSPEDKKAAAVGWSTLKAQEHLQFGTDAYTQSLTTIVTKTNMLPRGAQQELEANLVGQDPVKAAQAAATYKRLEDAAPSAALYDGAPTRSAALVFYTNKNIGSMDPAAAVTLARQTVDVSPQQQKQRDDDYTDAVKTNTQRNPHKANSEVLQTLANGWYGEKHALWPQSKAPDVPGAMRGDFEALTREFFATTGNIEDAQRLAGVQLHKSYGVTDVNGKPQIMKWGTNFPPEDKDVVREAIARVAAANGFAPEGPGDVEHDPARIRLTPDPFSTDRTQGAAWRMTTYDKDGTPSLLLGPDHLPVLFNRPLVTPQMRKHVSDAKALEDARALRDTKPGPMVQD